MWYILLTVGIVALGIVAVIFLQARAAQRKSKMLIDVLHEHPNVYKSIRTPRKDKAFPHHRKLSKREFREMLSDMLSEDELLLVTLHHYDEMTLDEIAFITGADEENVFKAYKKLKNKVKKFQNDQF